MTPCLAKLRTTMKMLQVEIPFKNVLNICILSDSHSFAFGFWAFRLWLLRRQHLASKVNLRAAEAATHSLSWTTPLCCLPSLSTGPARCPAPLPAPSSASVSHSDPADEMTRLPNSAVKKRRCRGVELGLPHILVVRVRFASCRALQFKFSILTSWVTPAKGEYLKENSETINFGKGIPSWAYKTVAYLGLLNLYSAAS